MDQMLKQRLIGAIVIISLAVIFIPMILEGPDDELSPRTQNMPPPPTIDYQTEVELPVPEESTEPAGAPADAATEQEVSAIPEPPMEQPEAVASKAEAPVSQAEPVIAKHPSPGMPSRASNIHYPGRLDPPGGQFQPAGQCPESAGSPEEIRLPGIGEGC